MLPSTIPVNNLDDVNDVENDTANPNQPQRSAAARSAWIEHERRQRSIRFLMMILMMLILMDGEQNANEEMKKKHEQHSQFLRSQYKGGKHLNLQNSNSSNSTLLGGGVGSDSVWNHTVNDTAYYLNGTVIMVQDLWNVRQQFDDKIRNSIQQDKRLVALNGLNDGIDKEQEIWDWAKIHYQDEDDKQETDNDTNKEKEQKQILTAATGIGKTSTSEEKKQNQKENDMDKAKEMVYHYPRNATGHFRGQWTRMNISTTSATTSTSPSTNEFTATTTATTSTSTSTPTTGMDATNSQNNLNKTEFLMHTQARNEILNDKRRYFKVQEEHLGIYILPPMKRIHGDEDVEKLLTLDIGDDDNGNSSDATSNPKKDTEPKGRIRGVTTTQSISSPTTQDMQPLYITESNGKLHFHFYSRPIPGMKEMSLIHGFMKIRDMNDLGFTNPKKHLFLQVRGVILHSIGKISLVANDGLLRSALFLFDEQDDEAANGGNGGIQQVVRKQQEIDVGKIEESEKDEIEYNEQEVRQRRKLQETILDLDTTLKHSHNILHQQTNPAAETEAASTTIINPEATSSTQKQKMSFMDQIDNIRDRALWIYSDFFDRIDAGENNDWSLFSSSSSSSSNELGNMEDNYFVVPGDDSIGYNHENEEPLLLEERIWANDKRQPRRLSETEKSDQKYASTSLSFAYPYPFMPHNHELEHLTPKFDEARTNANIPDQFFNRFCEFEINLDVEHTKWTVSEWREMSKRIIRDVQSVNPFSNKSATWWTNDDEALEDDGNTSESEATHSSTTSLRDEALVMNLVGTMESPNCDFALQVNATAFRMDWEQTKYKATIYSAYMILACLAQIILLLRQLIHSQSSSQAARVSLLCIGWQTIIDAILCIGHCMLCLMVPPVSTAFAMVSLFKFMMFYVIEMKYMVIIVQARNNAEGNQPSASEARRRLAVLQFRFFTAFLSAIIAIWYLALGQGRKKLCFMVMYSFWIPQIIYNVITESKKPMHKHYIYGMSITRLSLPLILFGVPNNFMQEIEPEFPSDNWLCIMLTIWVGIQTALLIGQSKYGARFMIPARFLPPKYDYSRPIPATLLPPQMLQSRSNANSEELVTKTSLESEGIHDSKGPRNRKEKRSHNNGESNGITAVQEEEVDKPTLDCVICYNPIDVQDRRRYMLAPCDHIFHRSCLEQWMDVKMECPTCRADLPSI